MTIKLTLFQAGYCTQSAHLLMRGGPRQTVRFPAIFALLEHPQQGLILFDTGYAPNFYTLTRRFPYSLYAKITPVYVTPSETAQAQLAHLGIQPDDIAWIIVSHFHADHLCGLTQFPQARFIFFQHAFESVRGLRGWAALRHAFLPNLLPPDFAVRAHPLDPHQTVPLSADYAPFTQAVDLFGDGSLLAVELPGHAVGQMGLFVETGSDQRTFLIAEACWHSRAYRESILPHPLVRLFFADWGAYKTTFAQISQFHCLHPDVPIIPSHCSEVAAGIARGE